MNFNLEKLKEFKGLDFLIFLLLVEMCWILGAKVSEMLVDLMVLDISLNDIQTAESYYNFTVAGTVLFWGILVDRFPQMRKIILIVSNAIWIVASIIMMIAPMNFQLYIVIQILWGIAFGANGPILGSYLGDLFKINRRGALFSFFTIGVYLIKGSAIAVTGLIGTALGNWKIPSFIFSLGAIVLLIIFFVKMKGKEPKLASVEPEVEDKISSGFEYGHKITLEGFIGVIKKPTNLLFLAQGISGMIGVTIVTRYMNYWFVSSLGMGMNQGLAVLMLGAGGALGALFGILIAGKWVDREFKKGNIRQTLYFSIASLFLQVLFYLILTISLQYPAVINPLYNSWGLIFQYYPVFFMFIFVFNICVFFGTPIGTTVGVIRTHVNLPEHRGTAAALYDLFDFIGSGIGLLIGSALWSVLNNYPLTVFIGSCFWLISGVIWIFITLYIRWDYREVRNTMAKRSETP
jgi:MFS family permease